MNFRKATFLVLFLCFQLHALILETDQLSSVFSHIGKDSTLLIFDLDNTLVHVADGNGGDEWFQATLAGEIKKGLAPEQALEKTVDEYCKKQLVIDLQLVEEKTDEIVRIAQTQFPNVKVIALTTRGGLLVARTIDQLAKIGIDFSINPPYASDVHLDSGSLYTHGILFGRGNSKKALMEQFFTLVGYQPKKVIFVNDKEKYLHLVADAVEPLGIEFIGIRYSKLDEKVRKYRLS